ncbi:hypothetical protein ACFXOS_17900 [Streptomyces sp. NPDC059175]|uniref:hypothetical protein n=1 Tax=Streptomyces sp. NPDC059175 TaxID=3346757 RepID=UPI0036AE80CE
MADERYEWLDKDTAERLLRGEPVEPVGVDARSQAERLAKALDDTRVRDGATEPMRGEDAAVAAFRKARDGGGAELLPPVRLASAPSATRWGRPVRRWGLAASLAGVAVGGVAVAAVAGVVPTPFRGDRAPEPAASVSGDASPGPVASDTPSGGATWRPSPAESPQEPPASSSPHPSEPPADRPGGGATQGRGDDESAPSDDKGTGAGSDDADWYGKTVSACRDYRDGALDEESKQRLEAAARGADRVRRFCDRVLSSVDDDGDDNDGSSGGGGGRGGGTDEGDDGDDGPAGVRFPFLGAPVDALPVPAAPVASPDTSAVRTAWLVAV